MENFPLFFKTVREAQGISQKELADSLNKSQAAIAQFERMKAALAVGTLKNLAPLLNLNPEFIEKGTGNPFRQRDKKRIIKMFIPEEPGGKVDHGLIQVIAESNKRAIFLLLKPRGPGLSGQDMKVFMGPGRSDVIFAFLVKDEDENVFLFRRKEKNKILSVEDIKLILKNIAMRDERYFDIRVTEIGKDLFDDIKAWKDTDPRKLDILFKLSHMENQAFLMRTANTIWKHESMAEDQKSYKNIRKAIHDMSPEEVERLLARLIPELAEIIKKYVKPHNINA